MASPDLFPEQRGVSPDAIQQPTVIFPGEEDVMVGLAMQSVGNTTPEQFADQLRALVDPQTPEERASARASRDRVRETEQRLRRELGMGKPLPDWRATW